MNEKDDQLQNDIERGMLQESNDVDAQSYRILFNSLRKAPDYKLSPSFADRVVNRIEVKQTSKESWKDFFWLGAGVMLLLIALTIALAVSVIYLDFRPDFGIFSGLIQYKGLIILAAILVVVFNRLDHKFVLDKQSD